MKFIYIILCINIAACLAKPPKKQSHHPVKQHQQQPAQEFEYVDYDYNAPQPAESINHYDAYLGSAKKGYSAGSGLRSIAQGSADQANSAVANQHAAAKQAAYVAKNTLAQAAAQASATAQAALAGKQVILSGLEQQVRDAKVALDGETMQLQSAQRAANSAQQASQQASHQVNVIQAALNAAQATMENANQAASEAAGELAAQQAMVGSAKQRLNSLQEQLHGARIDFDATQAAAVNAQVAAQQAQSNAAEAAAKAAAAAAAVDAAQAAKTAAQAGVQAVVPTGHSGNGGYANGNGAGGGAHYDDYSSLAGDDAHLQQQYGYKVQANFHY